VTSLLAAVAQLFCGRHSRIQGFFFTFVGVAFWPKVSRAPRHEGPRGLKLIPADIGPGEPAPGWRPARPPRSEKVVELRRARPGTSRARRAGAGPADRARRTAAAGAFIRRAEHRIAPTTTGRPNPGAAAPLFFFSAPAGQRGAGRGTEWPPAAARDERHHSPGPGRRGGTTPFPTPGPGARTTNGRFKPEDPRPPRPGAINFPGAGPDRGSVTPAHPSTIRHSQGDEDYRWTQRRRRRSPGQDTPRPPAQLAGSWRCRWADATGPWRVSPCPPPPAGTGRGRANRSPRCFVSGHLELGRSGQGAGRQPGGTGPIFFFFFFAKREAGWGSSIVPRGDFRTRRRSRRLKPTAFPLLFTTVDGPTGRSPAGPRSARGITRGLARRHHFSPLQEP